MFFLGVLFLALSGCDDEPVNYKDVDEQTILQYLADNNIEGAKKLESGLYYTIEDEGSSTHPKLTDNVEVLCLGYYTNGDIIQNNLRPVTGKLNTFIYGWQYGIPLFGKGGKGQLFIPRHLAYGTEVLIFDIELRNIWQE
jgi:FKBP-type peptidyl-prolyl cis-trans isomerase